MATQWLRRGWLLAAGAAALLLAACGGGSIESQLQPSRIVAFGDAMADLGQNGARFTVNDGSVNVWTQYVATSFNLPLTPSSAGGLSYATGSARIVLEPDAGGSAATPTVREQVDTFLASNSFGANDLVLVSAGTGDVIYNARRAIENTMSEADALANADQAARDLAVQVRRLIAAGARYVVVAGVHNLGRTPWAVDTGAGAFLESISSSFNQRLLIAMNDLGANVLYVDAQLQFNLYTSNFSSYSLSNIHQTACTSVDAGEGIGTGVGQVDSSECTPATLRAADAAQSYLYADRVYPTPHGHQLLGSWAYSRIRERW